MVLLALLIGWAGTAACSGPEPLPAAPAGAAGEPAVTIVPIVAGVPITATRGATRTPAPAKSPTPTRTPTRTPQPTQTPSPTPSPAEPPGATPAAQAARETARAASPLARALGAEPASPLPTPAATAPITALLGMAVEAAATPAAWPTPDGEERTAHVPILMYHYLSTPPADADAYRKDLSVSPNLFAAQLDRLQAEGYTTISLYDLLAHLALGAPLPEKPLVITFDDGYRDNYENALPLLRERGMTATFFVVTDFIDEGRPEYLTWEMARAMLAAGMSVESHGRNHVSLEGKEADYLVWQALGSAETIEYELGVRPRFVSYPAGDYDSAVMELFHSANYWAGLTTRQGATESLHSAFELPRVRVRGTTTPDDLIRLLELDW